MSSEFTGGRGPSEIGILGVSTLPDMLAMALAPNIDRRLGISQNRNISKVYSTPI